METWTTRTEPFLGMDRTYFSSQMGRFSVKILVVNILCLLSVACQWVYIPARGWFYFVCGFGFWLALFELLIGLWSIQKSHPNLPWKLAYFVYHGMWTFFYLTAASAVTHYADNDDDADGYFACTFFGFIACVVYGISAYYRWADWRGSEVPAAAAESV